jgi:hypothetical protein
MAELLEPGLRVIYGTSYNDYPEEYTEAFEVDTSKKATETDFSMSGLGLAQEKAEGADVQFDTIYRGDTKTYTHAEYALGFSVTRIMYEDDLYRQIKARPKALARSVRHTVEILGANILNNAFTSGVGGDGSYLCATDHTIRTGTLSNKMNPTATFSVTSFEQALIAIQAWTDDRGLKIRVLPKKLIVSPSDAFQAQIVLKSAQMPGTANNDINPAQNYLPSGFTVMHWLTDPDAWFLKTDVPNGLMYFWRRRPEFTNDNDFKSEDALYKTTFRCSQGWTDWRGIYGAAGA